MSTIASCNEPLHETYILYFLQHLLSAVLRSLCGSNSNINAFSFIIHSDGNVFHLSSIVCSPPLHLSIDAWLQDDHQNSEDDIKPSVATNKASKALGAILVSLVPRFNLFLGPVNFSSLHVSCPTATTLVQIFIPSSLDYHSSITTSISPFSDFMTYASPSFIHPSLHSININYVTAIC